MQRLEHVNCSYLSTRGRAPTLTELKQHAQSLAVLIKELTVCTKGGIVDNANHEEEEDNERAFREWQAWDWLNDLGTHYQGGERHHDEMPLTSLMNTLEADSSLRDGEEAWRNICPLYSCHAAEPREEDDDAGKVTEKFPSHGVSHPYAVRQMLIAHANEVLEYLDHEYSSKGGVTAIVPTQKEDPEQRALAETTILGQLILYNQRLVQRLHDLERLYADAMDVIAGEANAPHQILSRLGPDGRKPRDLVYPQDRFVLVNAGEDVWQYLHQKFQQREVQDVKVDELYRSQGLTGERLWEERGGKEFARGITAIDVTTRYYRLRGDPLKTIFVIPAYEEHPGTKGSRKIRNDPTVVSVVKPLWPERVSVWEQKNRKELLELRTYHRDHRDDEEKIDQLQSEIEVLKSEEEKHRETMRLMQIGHGLPTQSQAQDNLMQELTAAHKIRDDALRNIEESKKSIEAHKDLIRKAQRDAEGAESARKRMEEAEREKLRVLKKIENKAKEREQQAEIAAEEMMDRLGSVIAKHMLETEMLKLHMKGRMEATEEISEETQRRAKEEAYDLVKQAYPGIRLGE